MGIGDALRELARYLDECEERGRVSGVGLAEVTDPAADGALTAEVELTLPTSRDDGEPVVTLREAAVSDGTLRLGVESTDPVVPTADGVDLSVSEAAFDPDGTVTVTLTASVPTDGEPASAGGSAGSAPEPAAAGDDAAGTASEAGTAGRDREVPPFRDPDLLREVYESCETFAEMPAELGMDVTAETVRRYMIDYGIHEPSSYDTSGGDEADDDATDGADAPEEASPVVLADGVGLPDDVTVDTIIETVQESNTIYEVKRDIGIEREDALEILRELNLLELVVGRLATEAEREISRETVVERMRESASAGVQ